MTHIVVAAVGAMFAPAPEAQVVVVPVMVAHVVTTPALLVKVTVNAESGVPKVASLKPVASRAYAVFLAVLWNGVCPPEPEARFSDDVVRDGEEVVNEPDGVMAIVVLPVVPPTIDVIWLLEP